MSGRDELLDLALAAVTGARQGDSMLADVIVSLDLDELRRFAGKVALIAGWAFECEDTEDLAATVELAQLGISR